MKKVVQETEEEELLVSPPSSFPFPFPFPAATESSLLKIGSGVSGIRM